MPLGQFILWSVAGAFPWTFGLILAGWPAGAYWSVVAEWAHQLGLYLLIIAACIAFFWLLMRGRIIQRIALQQGKRSGKGS